MLELSATLLFNWRDWTIGGAYPETDGTVGYPAIGIVLQFLFISFQVTLYKTWEVREEEGE